MKERPQKKSTMPAENGKQFRTRERFPDRGGHDWVGPLVDYKEIELIRKFLTASSKLMSRKRAGASAQEQSALRRAVKRARFMALIPYRGA